MFGLPHPNLKGEWDIVKAAFREAGRKFKDAHNLIVRESKSGYTARTPSGAVLSYVSDRAAKDASQIEESARKQLGTRLMEIAQKLQNPKKPFRRNP